MTVTASFIPATGLLSVTADTLANTVILSRDPAGKILVNGGAVSVLGGTPTVANTTLIQAFGLAGNDSLQIDEANGALPRTQLFGGTGNDTIKGGSGADTLFGQNDNDALFGRAGKDQLFGGSGNDTLNGGDGNDSMFGESGNDLMIWTAGDDSDLMEGGDGIDTAQINGGNGAEVFSIAANGDRVRFDRIDPAPFSLDIGTTENIIVSMGGGNDNISMVGNLAALTKITVDGGAGNDTISGGNGADLLIGGDGNDVIDGNQGNDVALLGAGDDVFQWDPGDGSDVVEGQAGTDTLLFNGSNASESMDISANGGRVRFFRDIATINMDLDDVETIQVRTLGGADNLTVNDLSGTDVKLVAIDLAGTFGGATGDGQVDNVKVNATNGNDNISLSLTGTAVSVNGLAGQTTVDHADAGDRLIVTALGGNDVINASLLPATALTLALSGGDGDDTVTGGAGADELSGDAGNDQLKGGLGNDSLTGGDGNDLLVGGAGSDVMSGGAGNDRMIWNPGDDSDVMEGGDGIDTAEVNGGNGAEAFAIAANGDRVRFDRIDPAPFSLDIGTTENLVVNMGDGDDSISAVGNLAALIQLTIDGGAGNDTILGGNGADLLIGGDGDDVVDGNQGSDVALMGAGDDIFQWDPGDGSDVVEGQAGTDTLLFNGANINETMEILANGGRVRFTRDIASIVMDLNGVEHIQVNARGGADRITVNDLSGTDVKEVSIDLAGVTGTDQGDLQPDLVSVAGTAGNDVIDLSGSGNDLTVSGLPALVKVNNSDGVGDQLSISAGSGDDVVSASTLPAGVMSLVIDGGIGNDTISGSQGDDVLIGGDGNDVVDGQQGNDVALLGAGDDLFQWDPGDGSDVVEGQGGTDTLQFNGANVGEAIDIAANGTRVRLFRDVGNINMDLNGIERINVLALAGADIIAVNDLSGTDVKEVNLDLAGTPGGTTGDGEADKVIVNGTAGIDTITVTSVGAAVVVKGLPAQVTIDHVEAGDTLTVNGGVGDDVINASSLVADKVALEINGGSGADFIIGSAGNDTVNGGRDNDVALLGAGDDVFVWNPGDGSDVVEGQGGADTLLFNGANIAETIDISANGDRVLFHRDVANITMDINDVERIDFNAAGGADSITVNDLSGTDVTQVHIDLAALFTTTGDGAIDTVTVNATGGDDVISLSSVGDQVLVSGLSAQVTLDHAEAGDRLVINGGAGDDVIDGSGVEAGRISLQLFGGAGDDVIIGSAGGDRIDGGAGDDVILLGSGNDVVQYSNTLNGNDVVIGFDGDAVGGQDVLDLDALFDGLGVAAADRAARVSISGGADGTVNVAIDADGNAANGFELLAVSLGTSDSITVGDDVLVGS